MTSDIDVEPSRSGRRVFLFLGIVVIAIGGLLGLFVGANGAEVTPELTPLGLVSVPVTPGTVALYGMVVAALFVGGLYGAVSFASRFDSER
ncbi:DUF7520 family protein [Haloferacaceae archaeon DSL9]